jgi:hypothetical protein
MKIVRKEKLKLQLFKKFENRELVSELAKDIG